MVTVRAVTPVSVAADVALDAEMPSATTSAAAKSTTFLIEAPLERYVAESVSRRGTFANQLDDGPEAAVSASAEPEPELACEALGLRQLLTEGLEIGPP